VQKLPRRRHKKRSQPSNHGEPTSLIEN
jgi:hypothetical protein